ncbi:Transcriptional adapter ada2, partial [Quaeritorhiza haematococci]
DILDFPLFDEDWAADEELLLIEGLEMFGLGNWEQIADHIGTKNKYECYRHYVDVFIKSADWPVPDMSKHFDKTSTRKSGRPGEGSPRKVLPKVPRPPASCPSNHEVQGYMPGRQEFETEYDNEAEQYVKDMVFEETDTQEDIALKNSVLNIYNTILDRRSERKKFIFERGLLDFKKIQAQEKKRPKDEKDVYQRMRVFAKMQTAEDFESLMDGILHEMKLRRRIAELQEYRRMGVTSIREAHEYEREKANRHLNIRTLSSRDPSDRYSRYSSRRFDDYASMSPARGFTSSSHRGSTPMLDRGSSSSSSFAMSPHHPGPSSSTSTSGAGTPLGAGATASTESQSSSSSAGVANTTTTTTGATATTASSSSSSTTTQQPSSTSSSSTSSSAASIAALLGNRKPANPLDIRNADSYDLLLPVEQTLCSQLRILPRAYIVIKDTLLTEYARRGGKLKKREARGLVKID